MYNVNDIHPHLADLEKKMSDKELEFRSVFSQLHKDQQKSASNLLHYLVLRDHDIRDLQNKLHIAGLSSLASSEGHIKRQLQAIRERLGHVYKKTQISDIHHEYGTKTLIDRSRTLFGNKESLTSPHIMVTFDVTFIENYGLIKTLLQNGMNVARINCAHDDESVWSQMIYLVRKACRKTGLDCKIYMDLAGPKIRTSIRYKGKMVDKINVREGDTLWLAEENLDFSKKEIVIHPNETGIVQYLKKGNRVFIDDGVIKGEVEKVEEGRVKVRIVRISSEKSRIKSGKGLNFPDSVLQIPSLTTYDLSCLPFIVENADLVGYSFVRYASDVAQLMDYLAKYPDKKPDIIIKIETPEAVQNLPHLLLQGMKNQIFGVMIARGDLAVEIGFERTGEIQDEILWICEAAHVPVIWATQVLESLNKSGMATRSEITDAAHAGKAECIMINKGDYTLEVIETLKEIGARMGGHQVKKRFTFRPLNIARRFFNNR